MSKTHTKAALPVTSTPTKTIFDKNGISISYYTSNPSVLLLRMNRNENRFSEEFVSSMHEAMDLISNPNDPLMKNHSKNTVLIITGNGKFFSNGLDLNAIAKRGELLEDITKLLSKILVIGIPTIAAINGHAFGAGLFIAICCDFRYMRNDRGYLCFPEASLRLPFGWPFARILSEKIHSKNVLRDAGLLSKRYTANQAKKDGLIDEIAPNNEQLLPLCFNYANNVLKKLSIHRQAYHTMKKELYINGYLAMKNFKRGDTDKYSAQLESKL